MALYFFKLVLNHNFLGNTTAPVADCKKQFFNAQEKLKMTVEEFLNYWEKYINDGYPDGELCLYLKVYHIK